MLSNPFVTEEIEERIERLDLDFNEHGVDKFGVSKDRIRQLVSFTSFLYKNYFRTQIHGRENIPRGRAMLISNHSGGVPTDGMLITTACFLELEPPRAVHAMVDKFFNNVPYLSTWFREVGQLIGLPTNARKILEDERALLVFPEGARGTGKLYKDRYKLVRFGTGFMRIAMQTDTPIVPIGFVGGEETVPSIFKFEEIAKAFFGAPYIPVPPHILPIPLPIQCDIRVGEPMHFEGDGNEPDDEIKKNVDEVKYRIRDLLNEGLQEKDFSFFPPSEAVLDRRESNH